MRIRLVVPAQCSLISRGLLSSSLIHTPDVTAQNPHHTCTNVVHLQSAHEICQQSVCVCLSICLEKKYQIIKFGYVDQVTDFSKICQIKYIHGSLMPPSGCSDSPYQLSQFLIFMNLSNFWIIIPFVSLKNNKKNTALCN